jgi:hypothetical protein
VQVREVLEADETMQGDLANMTLLTLATVGGRSVPVITSCLVEAVYVNAVTSPWGTV